MNLNGLNSFLIFPGQQLKVSGSVSSNSHSSYNSNSGGSSSTYTVRYGIHCHLLLADMVQHINIL